MFGITLYTRDGQPVTSVVVPPWKIPPEAYLWGERTFFRRPDGKYYEGLMVATAMTANHCLGNSEAGAPCKSEECACLCQGCVVARQFGQATWLPLTGERCDVCGNTEVAQRLAASGQMIGMRCENHRAPASSPA